MKPIYLFWLFIKAYILILHLERTIDARVGGYPQEQSFAKQRFAQLAAGRHEVRSCLRDVDRRTSFPPWVREVFF